MKKILIASLIFLSAACAKKIEYEYPNNQDYQRKSRAGSFLNEDLVVFGKKKDEKKPEEAEESQNNSALWQASVEVIGSLFPIDIVDKNSGIIATQWYQETALSDKRIKINALIKGREIVERNLRVSVFRQKKDLKGAWVGDGLEDSEGENGEKGITAKLIKEKILERAKKAL